ncbi:putative polysaccharide biosynthesis protein [Alloiococcus sp. CFN-8]|uniref:putative polysaccharide biosynthesis protein n=1 Tax=Alloiococcus sp. CFN-8 TaxID=3416081 RepID=UPI003CFA76C0
MKEQSSTKAVLILSISGILVKLLSLVYVPLLSGIIGSQGFGIYNSTYQVFTWLYAVTNVGMQPAIAKLVAELDEKGNPRDALKAFKITRALLLAVGFTSTLLMIILAKPISELTNNPRSVYSLMMLAPTITITSGLVSYRGYFQGRNIITPIGISQILEQLINVVVSLLFAYILLNSFGLEMGVAGATIGTSLGALVAVVYLIYIYQVNKYFKIPSGKQLEHRRHSTKYLLKKVIMYGLPITMSTGLQNFGALIDTANVRGRLETAGFLIDKIDTLSGYLGQYQTLSNVPLVFITAIGTITLPVISRALINRDNDRIKESISFAFKVSFIITIPAAVGLMLLSRTAFGIIYPGDPGGYKLLFFGSFITVLMGLIQLQATILQSLNKFYPVIVTLLIGIVVKILVNYILIVNPDINIYGAIIGGYAGYGITALLNIRVLRKTIRRKVPYVSLLSGPLAASGVMGIGVYLTNKYILLLGGTSPSIKLYGLSMILSIIVGVAFYAFALILMGSVTKEEIKRISPRLYNKIPKVIRRRMR